MNRLLAIVGINDMSILRNLLFVSLAVSLVIAASISYLWMPWKADRNLLLIDSKTFGGWNFVLVQKYSGRFLEPYEVSVLIRNSKGSNYDEYYVDGGTFYWHKGNLFSEGSGEVIIRKGSIVYAKFNINTEQYFHRNDWATPYDALGTIHSMESVPAP